MKIAAIYCMDKDETIQLGHTAKKWYRAGPRRADGETPGLEMTLNPMSGIITLDVPGMPSSFVHVSKVTAISADAPNVPAQEPVAVATAVAAPPADAREVGGDDPDDGSEEPTYADDEEIDDEEVAALLQGDAKKIVAKRKPGRPKKAKAVA